MRKLVIAAILAAPAWVQAGGPIRAELIGYEEVPAVATSAGGTFEARVAQDNQSVSYTLSFGGLQGNVTQSHIHFAQKSVNGSIIVWLCGSATNPGPAGTPACPQQGTVSGTFTSANVGASATTQQLSAGDLASFIDAMESGIAYVNVHTTLSPGGEIRGQLTARGESGK